MVTDHDGSCHLTKVKVRIHMLNGSIQCAGFPFCIRRCKVDDQWKRPAV
jgi:hypothetical protein